MSLNRAGPRTPFDHLSRDAVDDIHRRYLAGERPKDLIAEFGLTSITPRDFGGQIPHRRLEDACALCGGELFQERKPRGWERNRAQKWCASCGHIASVHSCCCIYCITGGRQHPQPAASADRRKPKPGIFDHLSFDEIKALHDRYIAGESQETLIREAGIKFACVKPQAFPRRLPPRPVPDQACDVCGHVLERHWWEHGDTSRDDKEKLRCPGCSHRPRDARCPCPHCKARDRQARVEARHRGMVAAAVDRWIREQWPAPAHRRMTRIDRISPTDRYYVAGALQLPDDQTAAGADGSTRIRTYIEKKAGRGRRRNGAADRKFLRRVAARGYATPRFDGDKSDLDPDLLARRAGHWFVRSDITANSIKGILQAAPEPFDALAVLPIEWTLHLAANGAGSRLTPETAIQTVSARQVRRDRAMRGGLVNCQRWQLLNAIEQVRVRVEGVGARAFRGARDVLPADLFLRWANESLLYFATRALTETERAIQEGVLKQDTGEKIAAYRGRVIVDIRERFAALIDEFEAAGKPTPAIDPGSDLRGHLNGAKTRIDGHERWPDIRVFERLQIKLGARPPIFHESLGYWLDGAPYNVVAIGDRPPPVAETRRGIVVGDLIVDSVRRVADGVRALAGPRERYRPGPDGAADAPAEQQRNAGAQAPDDLSRPSSSRHADAEAPRPISHDEEMGRHVAGIVEKIRKSRAPRYPDLD